MTSGWIQILDQTNKQFMKTPNLAPNGQWAYMWRPHKRTNTIWHIQLPYPKPTFNAAKLSLQPENCVNLHVGMQDSQRAQTGGTESFPFPFLSSFEIVIL
jgi:hypothetical protein